MVAHIKVEEKLHELAGSAEQVFAVTSVPDERKGEPLIVLHALSEGGLRGCLDRLAECDLPSLSKLRLDQFVHIENLPYLATASSIRVASGKSPLRCRCATEM
jgi:acyl-[acyl-carrier-protein]-phospholipid O-acyltransferase/long-chain-fatty-acid--[acyl-carrier-protein] ligase